MGMTKLEARCVRRAINTARKASEIDFGAITRAVLAEAGVAEMQQIVAKAYQAGAEAVHKAWVDCGGNCPGDPDFWEAATDYADAALAKIGANQ